MIGVARTCSCIIIVLDAMKPLGHKRIIEAELEGVGIRLNKSPPAITLKKKERGGLNSGCTGVESMASPRLLRRTARAARCKAVRCKVALQSSALRGLAAGVT